MRQVGSGRDCRLVQVHPMMWAVQERCSWLEMVVLYHGNHRRKSSRWVWDRSLGR
jgi:hypothetical protein